MNKKIFAILTLLIAAASVSAVSAFDLGDLFISGQNETVTISGVDFNIPAGYEEDTTGFTDDFIKSLTDQGLNISGKDYIKDKTGIGLFVVNFDEYGITQEDASNILGGEATTINGVEGSSFTDEDAYVFHYQKDDSLVIISTTDKNIVGDFIIA